METQVIYCLKNKINGRRYIGQTNNMRKRMNGHRSTAYNQNNKGYNYPLYRAIRRYGWDAFEITILEEVPQVSQKYTDERERYFIQEFNSYKEGYNLTPGGFSGQKEPLTYEEKLQLSVVLAPEEVRDIQKMLREGVEPNLILEKYEGKLTRSFLGNINTGYNFKNDEWEYPLNKYNRPLSYYKTKAEIKAIKQDLIDGVLYREIAEKWEISPGSISLINNGDLWFEEEYTYPLSIRSHSRRQNAATWVKDVQHDLMNLNIPMTEVAKKYDKAYSTIKKINSGASHRKQEYKYPLTSNRP